MHDLSREKAALRELNLLPLWLQRDCSQLLSRAGLPLTAEVDQKTALCSAKLPQKSETSGTINRSEAISGPTTLASDAALIPRAERIATLDWPALAEEVSGCTACPLSASRHQTVFGVGVYQPDWLFVGEAPGAEEDQRGEPFVGVAGRLLNNMLIALGVSRTEGAFIVNVLKCRPPGNRDPQPNEVTQCHPFLKRQIALLKPGVIVTLGRFASQALIADAATSLNALRGRVHQYANIPVVATYHPAYLLRSLRDKSKAWQDLLLAKAALTSSKSLQNKRQQENASTQAE